MPETDWLHSDSGSLLVQATVDVVVRQYRLDPATAADRIREAFATSSDLRRAVEAGTPAAAIQRTRAFKDAVTAAKRQIYYDLRRYSSSPDTQSDLIAQLAATPGPAAESAESLAARLAATHASTRERQPDQEHFHRELLALLGQPRSILDLGCGLHPLTFPFAACPTLEHYLAADKDPACTEALAAFARSRPEPRLQALRWDIGQGWPALLHAAARPRFDVALMLKLVPVLDRQEPTLLDTLRQTPADLWILSGSRLALAKRRRIEHRERACLRRFAESAGRQCVAEFTIGEEFVGAFRPGPASPP